MTVSQVKRRWSKYGRMDFLEWAEVADESIVRQLGARHVDSDISERQAVWNYVTNQAVATPNDANISVLIKFKISDDERMITGDPGPDGAIISGWLVGKH